MGGGGSLRDHRGDHLQKGGKYVREAAAQLVGLCLLDAMDRPLDRGHFVSVLEQARRIEDEDKVLAKIDWYLDMAEKVASRS